MLFYTLSCLTLLMSFMTVGEAVEINLFDDFGINENMDGIMETKGLAMEGRAFVFGDKKDDLLIKGEIVNEIAKQAKVYKSLTVSANVKVDPNQESTLVWIETIYGSPVLGIWIKCEHKNCKLTMLYTHGRYSYEKTFIGIGVLHDLRWHRLLVHISGMNKREDSFVSVYVDCAKQGEQALINGYNHLLPFIQKRAVTSHIRLAQRSRGNTFENPWRGSLQSVKFVFNREVSALTGQSVCPQATNIKQHHPPIGDDDTVLPFEKQEFDNTEYAALTGSLVGLENTMSNQIQETKYIRRLIENFHYSQKKQLGICAIKPCYPTVPCTNTPDIQPGYKCGKCPVGWEGDGANCTDIDECLLNPCFTSVKCINTVSGYSCDKCPDGYRGGVVEGSGRKIAMEKQVCTDIDECAESNTACARFSECVNTMGSYKCGACADGYVGNPYKMCRGIIYCSSDNPESNPCDANAECIKKHHGRSFLCSCKVGYAGDGHKCALDSDLDGAPDYALACLGTNCKKDNCLNIPNPDQSDVDEDGRGDACDDDIDGDDITNHKDNCPKVANEDQTDSDDDSYGDACDNCVLIWNDDQGNADGIGMGDACDPDMDNDGVDNRHDNCPMNKNPDQNDVDGDGVGDLCDNCPQKKNPIQKDMDMDLIGDACDDNMDRDGDGIQDSKDNCPKDPNTSQLDTDSDGKGNECDRDDDNDKIVDIHDNCPLISNNFQKFSAAFGRGIPCKHDFDGDGVKDREDSCPKDARMSAIDFRKHVIFEPDVPTRTTIPVWKVDMKGQDVREETESGPSMLIGSQAFESMEFNATTFVNANTGDNMIGLVFGFQSSNSFYVATWKRDTQSNSDEKPIEAHKGLIIKEVMSSTGPSEALRNALWNSESVRGQTTVLWKDPKMIPWDYLTSYKWILSLDASRKHIELNVFKETENIISSPKLYAGRFRGGRLGMFTYSQGKVLWTALAVKCL